MTSWVVPGSRLLNGKQSVAPYKAAPLPPQIPRRTARREQA